MPDSNWGERAQRQINEIWAGPGLPRQLDMLAAHCAASYAKDKPLPLLALPLFLRARRIVELGSSFSYYPERYGTPPDPWGVSESEQEGLISTRVLLTACEMLAFLGVECRVTSVDLRRPNEEYTGRFDILTALGLARYWEPVMGTSTLDWLAREQQRGGEPIDLALVDSNHTYEQVRDELEGILPLMAPESVIVVDDCYETVYRPGANWVPEESELGIERGGEYGAVLEFLKAHPEWRVEWLLRMAVLYRPGDGSARVAKPKRGFWPLRR